MKDKNKKLFFEMLFGLTAAGKVFLPVLAAAACLSVNVYYALVSAIVCLALSVALKKKVLSVNAFLLVPVVFVASAAGNGALPFAVFAGCILCVLLSLPKNLLNFPPYVKAGAAIGLAFAVTVLFTTYYFGIGASGSTAFEMLKNYRYLGFHPNWRGVFFGTVTLFAMIVFPYRFKKLSKYLPAEFVSLLIPLLLNLFLNPDKNSTPILEVGALSDMTVLSGVKSFLPLLDFSSLSDGETIVTVLKGAFALAVVWALFKPQERKDSLVAASCGAVSSLLGGFPAARRNILKYTPVSALTAVAVSVLFAVFGTGIISRIPLHSLAVVFIVSVWQRVPFRLAAPVFAKRSFIGLALFFVSALVFVFFNPFIAAIICVVFSVAAGRDSENEKVNKKTPVEKKTFDKKKLAINIVRGAVYIVMASVFLLDTYSLILCNKYEKEYSFAVETFDYKYGDDRIHFLNTANSDCMLIESNGRFALVDSGEGNSNPRKKTEYCGFRDDVINYIKKVAAGKDGKAHLDFILGTHCHYDHYGNFEDIIKNDDIVIKKAYFKEFDQNVGTKLESEGWGNIQTYQKIIDALKEKNIPLEKDLPDKEFMFGDFRVRFINTVTPQELIGKGENAASVGVLLEKGERTAFLAADFTANSGLEKRYGDEIGHVDLLKIGHHGYFGSSSRSFIKKLTPKIAIVTNYLGKIYPNVKWNLTVTAKAPIYSCVNHDGIVATFTDTNEIVLTDRAM